MDAASLFKRSTPFRRLSVAAAAAVLLAVALFTFGRPLPDLLDGLLSDLAQRGAGEPVNGVHVVTLPGSPGASGAGAGTSLPRSDLARLHDRLLRAGAASIVLQVQIGRAHV